MRSISPRQREILVGLCNGETSKGLAATLGISAKTIDVHRTKLRRYFGARTTPQLVKLAIEAGLLLRQEP